MPGGKNTAYVTYAVTSNDYSRTFDSAWSGIGVSLCGSVGLRKSTSSLRIEAILRRRLKVESRPGVAGRVDVDQPIGRSFSRAKAGSLRASVNMGWF